VVLLAGGVWFWWPRPPEQPGVKTSTGSLPPASSPGRTTATSTDAPAALRASTPPSVLPEVWTRRPVTNLLEAQIALTWHGISCGPVDGVGGRQTELALQAFQRRHFLHESGWLDRDTAARLELTRPLHTTYTITAADLARLLPVPGTWLGKSEAPRLDYETILELVAERFQAHPNHVRRLNPTVDWPAVAAGTTVIVPNAQFPPPRRAALVRVSLGEKWIRAFDDEGRLLGHFPCSIGRVAQSSPKGELRVAVAIQDPNYTFNPEVFPESEEGRRLGRKLVVPPGPNNPVGVAWIGLSQPGYGIHGTPVPEQVGRTESHGCFRLANWNADFLRRMVTVGTPVWIE